MEIIRDEEMNGIMMIPLFHQYGIHYCNVEGCPHKASTILIDAIKDYPIGICEGHYIQAKQDGQLKHKIDLNHKPYKPIE